jgi:hypothetical protein
MMTQMEQKRRARIESWSVQRIHNEGLWCMLGANEHIRDWDLAIEHFKKSATHPDSAYFLKKITHAEQHHLTLIAVCDQPTDPRDAYLLGVSKQDFRFE